MNGCRILVGYLKAAVSWIGHVNRMDSTRKVSQVVGCSGTPFHLRSWISQFVQQLLVHS
jgi:hypothetical protein